MQTAPKAKLCSRCKTIKPAASFRRHQQKADGLDSWCKSCKISRTKEFRKQFPNDELANRELKATYGDPLAYSRHKCLHVADYVRTAIERFERKTGKEAPPHLTAILQLAESLADEHPANLNRIRTWHTCPCGNTFHARKDAIYCSQSCKDKAQFQRVKADPERYEKYLARHNERIRMSK